MRQLMEWENDRHSKALASPKSQSTELLNPEYPSSLNWAETVRAYCKI